MTTEYGAVEKVLRPGEARFEVRARKTHRGQVKYDVYDRARASYPAIVLGLGRIPGSMTTREEAEVWAARLAAHYGVAA
jgi:hypothetical protein